MTTLIWFSRIAHRFGQVRSPKPLYTKTDLIIKNFKIKIETYLISAKIAPEIIVGMVIQKIKPRYFKEIRLYISKEYY